MLSSKFASPTTGSPVHTFNTEKNDGRRVKMFSVEFKLSTDKYVAFDVCSNSDIHNELFAFFQNNNIDTLMVLPFYCQINQTLNEIKLGDLNVQKSVQLKRTGSMNSKTWMHGEF